MTPLELYIPVYRRARRKRWQIASGLTLYDWLSADRSLPGRTVLSRAELLARMPGLNPADLVGGASYYDAQARYPERLVVENVRDAVANGAMLQTYTRATRIRVDAGRVTGVDWRTAQGATGAASAPLVVNAAGPWVDEVLGPIKHTRLIGGTKGSHLIAAPFAGAPRAAGVYVEAGSDSRPLFILPWNDLLLVGTTDERFDGDAGAASIDDRELAYLARETERVFPAAAGLAERVLYTHTGVRPLPYRPRGAAGAITRRHLIRRHRAARGLYSIVGGKLTTHRALAEDVLKVLWRDLPPAARVRPTRDRPLPGALDAHDREALLAEIGATHGSALAARLVASLRRSRGGDRGAREGTRLGRDGRRVERGARRGARLRLRDGMGRDARRHSAAALHGGLERGLRVGRSRARGALAPAARHLGRGARGAGARRLSIVRRAAARAACALTARAPFPAVGLVLLLDGLEPTVGRSPCREYRCSLAMSASARSRSSRVRNQCCCCQPLPSSRAKVSVGGRLTRIPYGFGASSDSFKLCAWQMSIETAP